MATKQFVLANGLPINIVKRRGSKSLKITVTNHGQIRVVIPAWARYGDGLKFANSRLEWLETHYQKPRLLENYQHIGKAHRLELVADNELSQIRTRLLPNRIVVRYPSYLKISDESVQTAATKACNRALKTEAEALLPQRLSSLASQHNFNYKSVKIKRLKGRWGSCDHETNIVLNLYLMQLPWELIDYVLLHELTHTVVLKHGPEFWAAMSTILPNVKQLKSQLVNYQPVVIPN